MPERSEPDPGGVLFDAISDERAAAIGRLAIAMNSLEDAIEVTIFTVLHAEPELAVMPLLQPLPFSAKVARLRAIAELLQTGMVPADAEAPVEDPGIARAVAFLSPLLKEVDSLAKFRNETIHARIDLSGDTISFQARGKMVDLDPDEITAAALRAMALGSELFGIGLDLRYSVRAWYRRTRPQRVEEWRELVARLGAGGQGAEASGPDE